MTRQAARALKRAVEAVGQVGSDGDHTVEKRMAGWRATRAVREE